MYLDRLLRYLIECAVYLMCKTIKCNDPRILLHKLPPSLSALPRSIRYNGDDKAAPFFFNLFDDIFQKSKKIIRSLPFCQGIVYSDSIDLFASWLAPDTIVYKNIEPFYQL